MLIDQLLAGEFEHTPSVQKRLFYAAERTLCHAILRRRPPSVDGPRLLNLGCGPHMFEGWVNADDYAIKRYFRQRAFRPNWRLDITRTWLCDRNHWDGIFTEHVIEMLSFSEAVSTLKECFLTLKPGAWVRIGLPDLKKYVAIYEGRSDGLGFPEFPHPALAVSFLTRCIFTSRPGMLTYCARCWPSWGSSTLRRPRSGKGRTPAC